MYSIYAIIAYVNWRRPMYPIVYALIRGLIKSARIMLNWKNY